MKIKRGIVGTLSGLAGMALGVWAAGGYLVLQGDVSLAHSLWHLSIWPVAGFSVALSFMPWCVEVEASGPPADAVPARTDDGNECPRTLTCVPIGHDGR
jgi:hypothetical protein